MTCLSLKCSKNVLEEVLGIPKVTSFSRMRISVAVNGSSSSKEYVLNVGLYFEKMGFYSQCHIKTCLYSLVYIQNTSYR